MNRPRVEMVVFDLGGVIVRICRTWAEGCAAAGLPVRGEMGSAEMIARRRALSEQHGLGRLPCGEYYQRMAATLDGRYSAAEVQRIHDAWLLGEYPGVDGLIRSIKSRGVRTGILSNTNAAHWDRQLSRMVDGAHTPAEFPTPDLVDHPHASHIMGLLKPSPDIYRAFERSVGVAGPGIVFFDDLAENVESARRAGWTAHQVDHTGDTAAQMNAILREAGVL